MGSCTWFVGPQSIRKAVRDLISISQAAEEPRGKRKLDKDPESMDAKELKALISEIKKKMNQAAAELNFERAAELRDEMLDLKKFLTD